MFRVIVCVEPGVSPVQSTSIVNAPAARSERNVAVVVPASSSVVPPDIETSRFARSLAEVTRRTPSLTANVLLSPSAAAVPSVPNVNPPVSTNVPAPFLKKPPVRRICSATVRTRPSATSKKAFVCINMPLFSALSVISLPTVTRPFQLLISTASGVNESRAPPSAFADRISTPVAYASPPLIASEILKRNLPLKALLSPSIRQL